MPKKSTVKDETIACLQNENYCLSTALNSVDNGSVRWTQWLHNTRLGLCRATSASGGVVIHKDRRGIVGAYYFESWAQNVLRTAETVQTPEWLDLRHLVQELMTIKDGLLAATSILK